MRNVIAVDLGGTQVRVARCDEAGTILAHARTDTAAREGPDAVVEQIVGLIDQLRAGIAADDIVGVGVGTPGPVDGRSGLIYEAPNLRGWINVPLRTILHERTGLPVEVGNDANAAALGEWLFGSGRGTDHFAYVTISTGIGGGIINDRALLLGRKAIGGEVGHMVVKAGGYRCGCGNYGCWETLAAGPALARHAADAIGSGAPTALREIASTRAITPADVAAAARAGDALAVEIMEREGEYIGLGLVNILHLYSPDRIALGGGVMKSGDLLLPAIHRTVQTYAMTPYRDAEIGLATLGDHTGILGAAALVLAPDAARGTRS
jgi:glucokinase